MGRSQGQELPAQLGAWVSAALNLGFHICDKGKTTPQRGSEWIYIRAQQRAWYREGAWRSSAFLSPGNKASVLFVQINFVEPLK